MAAKQMDAISSFQHVVDNIPLWKAQLTDLSTYAAAKYEEFVAEYKKLMHQVKHRRDKTDSIASIHSDGSLVEDGLKSPQPSDLVEINPLEAGNRFIYAQARRKRRPGTSLRSNNSGPRPIRNKRMVVIYYDSHIQSELDKLVKAFGAARNNLRKGKNAYTVAKGFALPNLGRRFDTIDHLMPNIVARTQTHSTKSDVLALTGAGSNVPSAETAFITADKELEAIQSLCENAAHQAIRDGDCVVELTEALTKLDILMALTESMLAALEAEKKQQEEASARQAEASEAPFSTSSQSTLCEKSSSEAFPLQHKIVAPTIEHLQGFKRPGSNTMSPISPQALATDAIEVDDDEDDDGSSMDVDFDFAKYRSTSRQVVPWQVEKKP